jgi:hypothetical protein
VERKRYSAYFANAIRECGSQKNRFAAQSPPKNAHNETAFNANECEARPRFAHRATSRKVNFMPHPTACSAIASSSLAAREFRSHRAAPQFARGLRRMGPLDLNKLREIRLVSQ